jgi:alkanesulfonate monooxygenase SsuD/methylene tetrahydromethanopterin reductase-like flavin-dependent oxidoreductase (luciferase family)
MCATVEPPDDAAERIAAWLDKQAFTFAPDTRDTERRVQAMTIAADIRAGAWKKETT